MVFVRLCVSLCTREVCACENLCLWCVVVCAVCVSKSVLLSLILLVTFFINCKRLGLS